LGCVAAEHEEGAGCQAGAVGKSEVDAAEEGAAEIEYGAATFFNSMNSNSSPLIAPSAGGLNMISESSAR